MNKPNQIWLHRISHHAEAAHPLLAKSVLTIGFSDFCSPEFLERTMSKDWTYFDNAFATEWPDSPRSKARHSLARFIAWMNVGDWVLVPSWGTFSVYRIESEPRLITALTLEGVSAWGDRPLVCNEKGLFIGDDGIDLGFYRLVSEVVTNISRYDFADGPLTSRMKIRTTNADISDLASNVQVAIAAFRANRPINLHSQILDGTRDAVLKLIQEQLNPDKFELLIKWFFEGVGATNVEIPAKNASGKEGDADVVATFEHMKTVYYVQAKLHSGETNGWAVQQIKDFKAQQDRMDDGYTRIAWVVSTAESFSPECIQLAKENSIGLFTGPDIARMILEAGIQNLDKAFL